MPPGRKVWPPDNLTFLRASCHRKNVLCAPYVSAKNTHFRYFLEKIREGGTSFLRFLWKFSQNLDVICSAIAHCFQHLLNYAAEVSASWQLCSNILTLISYDTVPTTSPSTSATKYPKRGHIKNLQTEINNHKVKRKIRTFR